jgi:hypothetical protein
MMVPEYSDEELNIREETIRRVRASGIDISLAEVYTGEPTQDCIPQARLVNIEREQQQDVEKCPIRRFSNIINNLPP